MAEEEVKVVETQEVKEETVPQQPQAKKKFGWGDVIKCTLVLVIIACVAGAVLGAVNYLTYVDPDAVIKETVAGFYSASSEEITKLDYSYEVGASKVLATYEASGKGYCFYTSGAHAKDGSIELLVYIDSEGIIKGIDVYEQGETAGYFDKVESANKAKYLNVDVDDISGFAMKGSKSDFNNISDENAKVIDAVASATYTSSGYHNAIAIAVAAYKNIGGAK